MIPLKVSGAAVLGFTAPSVNSLLENVDPVLKTLILFGQVGIAFATVAYIFYQGMQIRANLKAKREEDEAKRKKKRK